MEHLSTGFKAMPSYTSNLHREELNSGVMNTSSLHDMEKKSEQVSHVPRGCSTPLFLYPWVDLAVVLKNVHQVMS